MALIQCSECKAEISDTASACIRCGAPMARAAPIGSMPPPAQRTPKPFKWWLWVPIGAVLLFLAYGASIPQNERDANAFRSLCAEMYKKGQVSSQSECDRHEAELRTTPSR